MKDKLELLAFIGIVVTLIFIGVGVMDKVGCESRWKDSGRKIDWSVTGGCRVSDKNGNLIPEKNLRDVQ